MAQTDPDPVTSAANPADMSAVPVIPRETRDEVCRLLDSASARRSGPEAITAALVEAEGFQDVRRARAELETRLAVQPVQAEPELVLLAAHELLANAVLHGAPPVSLVVADGSAELGTVVAVLDFGDGTPRYSHEGFHGLAILASMSGERLSLLPGADGGKWTIVCLPATVR